MNIKQFRSLWWQFGGEGEGEERGLLFYKCHLSVSNCRDFRSSWGPELRINYFDGRLRSLLCCTLKCSSCNDVMIRCVKDCQLIKLTRKSERHGIQKCVTD